MNDTTKDSDIERQIGALTDQELVALLLTEAGDERPNSVDTGRLANRICDAAGIDNDHPGRAQAYHIAMARLPGLADLLPNARYVVGLT